MFFFWNKNNRAHQTLQNLIMVQICIPIETGSSPLVRMNGTPMVPVGFSYKLY